MIKIRYSRPFRRRYLDYFRTIHSIKTAFACVIGLAIEKFFNFPQGMWIPITTMVVMSAQSRFGGALTKAYMRFLGTFSGVIITISTLWFFGNNLPISFLIVFLSCILFTYIAGNKNDINYAGTLGGVTVILTLTASNATIYLAIQRGLYIVIGTIIALLTSRFIFPIHARDLFRSNVANTLLNLKKLYAATMQIPTYKDQHAADMDVETIIISDLSEQPRLILEASAGSRNFAAKRDLFTEIVNSQRRLHRHINLTYRTLCEIENPEIIKNNLAAVETAHAAVANELEGLAACFETAEQPQCPNITVEVIEKITQLVEKIPKIEDANKIIAEHSFLFFMEQIIKEIEILYDLITKVNYKK